MSNARTWGYGENLREIWDSCPELDRLLWLCLRMAGKDGWPDHRAIVNVACDIADSSVPYLPTVDPSLLHCAATSRKWLDGQATVDDMVGSRIAAYGWAYINAFVWDAPACSSEEDPDASCNAAYAIDSAYGIYAEACKSDRGEDARKNGLNLLRKRLTVHL